MTPTLKYLWGEVLRSPAHGVAHTARGPGHDLGEPEVGDDGVALGVQEDVLGLEVPVGDVEAVQIGEGGDDLCRVELDRGGGQSVIHPHEGEQLAPRLEREQEVEIVRVLPAVSQRYQERVVDFLNMSL